MFSVTGFLIFSCFCIFNNNLLPVLGNVKPDPISTSTIESTSALTTEGSTSVETTPEFVTRRRTTTTLKPKTTTKPPVNTQDDIIDWMLRTLPTTTRRVRIATTTRTTPTTTVRSTTITRPLTTTRRTTIPTTVTNPRTTPQTTQKYFPRYKMTTKSPTYDPFNEIYKDVFPYVWNFDQPKPLPPFYHDSIYNQPDDEYHIYRDESITTTPKTTTTVTSPKTTTKPLVIYQNDGKYWVISNYRNYTGNNKDNAIYFQDSVVRTREEEDHYPSHLYGEGLRYPTTTIDKITKRPTYKPTPIMTKTITTISPTTPPRTTAKLSTRSEEYIDTVTPSYAEYPPAGAKASYGIDPSSNSNPFSYIRIQPKIYESNPNPQEKSYYQDIQTKVPNMKYFKYGDPAKNSHK